MKQQLSIGHTALRALQNAVPELGASASELAAMERLERGEGDRVDVERLTLLAELAGLPWSAMWDGVL